MSRLEDDSAEIQEIYVELQAVAAVAIDAFNGVEELRADRRVLAEQLGDLGTRLESIQTAQQRAKWLARAKLVFELLRRITSGF